MDSIERLKQYLDKASFSNASDKFSALECITEIERAIACDPCVGLLPCPFCGATDLCGSEWWDDDGEYEAVACKSCKAEAPASSWNNRA